MLACMVVAIAGQSDPSRFSTACHASCKVLEYRRTCWEIFSGQGSGHFPQTCDALTSVGCECTGCCHVASPPAIPAPEGFYYQCLNMCGRLRSSNGQCEDGGPGSESQWSDCPLGTDCADCGPRLITAPPPPPRPSPPPSPAPPAFMYMCDDSCDRASDGVCEDGGHGSDRYSPEYCTYGTDCSDCGQRLMFTALAPMMCSNTCSYAHSGLCQDGGWIPLGDSKVAPHLVSERAVSADCPYGTDCADCGPRFLLPPTPPLQPRPPPTVAGKMSSPAQYPLPKTTPPSPSSRPKSPPSRLAIRAADSLALQAGDSATIGTHDDTSPLLLVLLSLIFVLLAALVALLAVLPRRLQRLYYKVASAPILNSSHHVQDLRNDSGALLASAVAHQTAI